MSQVTPTQISAVVCTKNSMASIEPCLESLRSAGVGEIVVVDANSTDGTRVVVDAIADLVLSDAGTGLGAARNLGIRNTSLPYILNFGSDNVLPPGQLELMIEDLEREGAAGVSAVTEILGDSYVSAGLNAWRRGRFRPGRCSVIGTPTLFVGDLLRQYPYDESRAFSDDSELCERWHRDLGSVFAISSAHVQEIGKTSWKEVLVRCRMYGISDHEVYSSHRPEWTRQRRIQSLLHPLKQDFLLPASRSSALDAVRVIPFLAIFVMLRYTAWFARHIGQPKRPNGS